MSPTFEYIMAVFVSGSRDLLLGVASSAIWAIITALIVFGVRRPAWALIRRLYADPFRGLYGKWYFYLPRPSNPARGPQVIDIKVKRCFSQHEAKVIWYHPELTLGKVVGTAFASGTVHTILFKPDKTPIFVITLMDASHVGKVATRIGIQTGILYINGDAYSMKGVLAKQKLEPSSLAFLAQEDSWLLIKQQDLQTIFHAVSPAR